AGAPDAVDVRQADPDLLVLREVHSRNARHRRPLSLPLLVLRVLADDPDHSGTPDDLALRADPPDRRTNFHGQSPSLTSTDRRYARATDRRATTPRGPGLRAGCG